MKDQIYAFKNCDTISSLHNFHYKYLQINFLLFSVT